MTFVMNFIVLEIYLALEYELIAEKKECKDDVYTYEGSHSSLDACASQCQGKSSVFTYGRQGTNRTGHCYSWTDSSNGECAKGEMDNPYYNLYRFKEGKFLDFSATHNSFSNR